MGTGEVTVRVIFDRVLPLVSTHLFYFLFTYCIVFLLLLLDSNKMSSFVCMFGRRSLNAKEILVYVVYVPYSQPNSWDDLDEA